MGRRGVCITLKVMIQKEAFSWVLSSAKHFNLAGAWLVLQIPCKCILSMSALMNILMLQSLYNSDNMFCSLHGTSSNANRNRLHIYSGMEGIQRP